MKGRERTRKKHLRHAGWQVVSEGRAEGNRYRLTLHGRGGQEVTVEAPTRPRAYLRAETLARQQAPAPAG